MNFPGNPNILVMRITYRKPIISIISGFEAYFTKFNNRNHTILRNPLDKLNDLIPVSTNIIIL